MILLKQDIIDMLEESGDLGTAVRARTTLRDEIDTDRDHELLKDLGINIEYLLDRRSEG
jgi:hypothetical protein